MAVLYHKYAWTVILIIVTFVHGELYPDIAGSGSDPQNSLSSYAGYYDKFITRNNTKVMAQKGGNAILPCTVKLTSPATVSWIRRKDFQLLTVGLSTYSSDERFKVEHARHMGHWALRIRNVRKDDAGFYECQLSVHPVQSIFIELRVVEAVAEILGAPDLHIDEGSSLRLECKLKRATENPSYVFWYHEDKMVNYDAQDGYSVASFQSPSTPLSQHNGGSHHTVGTNRLLETPEQETPDTAAALQQSVATLGSNGLTLVTTHLLAPSTSILSIKEVHFKHAGNYTCAPSNARAGTITIHVLRGEKPAAMQHANRSSIDEAKSNTNSINCKYYCHIIKCSTILFCYYLIVVMDIGCIWGFIDNSR